MYNTIYIDIQIGLVIFIQRTSPLALVIMIIDGFTLLNDISSTLFPGILCLVQLTPASLLVYILCLLLDTNTAYINIERREGEREREKRGREGRERGVEGRREGREGREESLMDVWYY